MLPEADPEPRIRIFGDGRVHVHFPVYMQRAGDYETYLTRRELRDLVRSLVSRRVLEFDARRARQRDRDILVAEQSDFTISDAATAEIVLNLNTVRRRGEALQRLSGPRRARASNLRQRARRFAANEDIQDLAAAERALQALIDFERLVRVD